nr:bHLH93 [Broussonetia papyrifera]
MELNEHGFLEELLALRRDMTWEAFNPTEMNIHELLSSSSNASWGFENYHYFDQNNPETPNTKNVNLPNSSSCSQEIISPTPTSLEQSFNNHSSSSFNEVYYPSFDFSAVIPHLTTPDQYYNSTTTFPNIQEDHFPLSMEEEELGILGDEIHNLETQISCKTEPIHQSSSPEMSAVFNAGVNVVPLERKAKGQTKKLQGQPSKNLMAERRRRKRLNDRLSMLRSIVPKISKMDRTSILGDTIDYMKELLERINSLQQEIESSSAELSEIGLFKDVKPNEVLVRNSPKFDVERRDRDTRIEICCGGKPGLLCSTVTTLEALGLEIEQCVISCFNDFAMQASCSEDLEKRTLINSEDVKQALFRNAGYGGRCL